MEDLDAILYEFRDTLRQTFERALTAAQGTRSGGGAFDRVDLLEDASAAGRSSFYS